MGRVFGNRDEEFKHKYGGIEMSLNKVMLLGRLGSEPEMREVGNGNNVCNFSVATSEKWKDKQGNAQEKTEWHRISAFGKLAEICNQYLSKGREVFIEGKLSTRSWEDDQGNKRYATDIIASNVQFIGGKKDDSAKPESQAAFTASDVPF